MAYERKVLAVLDKLVDSIIYEEGRLALINKYGPMLSDEEKVKATELITKQRASLDRLFQIYKNELDPVMLEISETSSIMEPLVEKLLFADKVARNVAAVQEATGENPFNNVEENNPLAMAAKYTETPVPVATEAPVVVETPAPVAASEETAPVETPAPVAASEETAPVETPAPVQADSAAEVVETPAPVATETETVVETPAPTIAPAVEETAPVVNGEAVVASAETPASDLVIPAAGESEVHEATADAVENAASDEAATNTVESAAGALSGFVLSPIDEDIAPVPTKEEVKAAEEGVAAADQQLQAVDLMKTEIESNPNLTEEEKKEELEKYRRITEGAVRAILVTKAQYEKLLASRAAQKALLGNEKKEEASVDAVIPAIAGEAAVEGAVADVAPAENTATEGAVIPAIVTDTPAESNAVEVPAAETGEAVVALPTIEDGANVTPPGATGEAILPTIEIPGATPAGGDTSNANELQTMIEQGNALYKEGKTEEAEAVFNQVGELNKEIQGTIPTVEEAKVLVKE